MLRPSLFLTRRLPLVVEEALVAQFDIAFPDEFPADHGALIAAMGRYDGICCTVADPVNSAVIGAANRRATIIASYGVGFEHIDLDAARAEGVVVTNTPGVLTDATADLAILLMLMASRRAGEGERQVRAGAWTGWSPSHMVGMGIQGRLLGLVGFGRIAQATALRARALGMQIAYHARRRAPLEVETALGARFVASLGTLAEEADVLSLHCPGGPETRHLVNAAMLAKMKATAILINTARGPVVDEHALAAALSQRRIFSAGLDVYEDEPVVSRALLDLENVVLLPHLGSATDIARKEMGMRMLANLEDFFGGKAPRDQIA